MKAEETVMNDDKIEAMVMEHCNIGIEVEDTDRAIAKAQAEISFKAGIQEVVDWLLSEGGFPWSMDEYPERIKLWQAKLKEWGL